ncbi:hypothetical protein [Gordonia sp. SND2]|uniref:hypothetical protein n=1 Tax=Gordonia sp. SND2 TaxID=3388659 RepID=UPI00398B5FFA
MTDQTPTDMAVALDGIAPLIDSLDQIAIREAELAEAKRTLTEQIKAALGDRGTVGTVDGKVRVTWREHTRRSIDQKALRADYPEIAEKVEKVSTVRTFKVGGGR